MKKKLISLAERELRSNPCFNNLHVIALNTVGKFLVEPYPVLVDPDDLESEPREMWVVLKEMPDEDKGYLVVYDPLESSWGVAEKTREGMHQLVIGADTFTGALDGM